MSNIILADKLGVCDERKTIRGFVSIFDEVKKKYLIKDKENMVMNSGREFVKQLFVLNSGILGKTQTASFNPDYTENFNISACVFGTSTNVSQPNMVYVPSDYVQDYNILSTSSEFAVSVSDELIMQITIKLNGKSTNQTMISNLALVMTTGTNEQEVRSLLESGDNTNTALFSRLLFDPIPVGAGTTQTITYCIYF